MHIRYIIPSFILFLALFISTLSAEPPISDNKKHSLRIGYGFADFNNLGDILFFDFEAYKGKTHVTNLDAGWRFAENMKGLPFDWYLKGGLSYFNENDLQDNFLEGTLYVKVYYKLDAIGNRIRIGLGEGLSWAEDIPIVELDEASNEGTNTANLLNYLDISADLDLGRLLGVEPLKDLYIGYTIKHRSGVFGLFSGVKGGSNYQMFTIEKNF